MSTLETSSIGSEVKVIDPVCGMGVYPGEGRLLLFFRAIRLCRMLPQGL